MEEKIKFIIIGLAGILVVSIFINLQTYSAKKAIERERSELRSENETLTKKIEEAIKERKKLQEEINALNSNLDRVSQEKEDLKKQKEEIQEKYEALIKERDTLLEKLKPYSGISKEGAGSVSAKEDAYWARVLEAKTGLSLQVENLRSELKTLQADNEGLRSELESQMRENQNLEQQLNYNQKMFENISSQLVLEKSVRLRFEDELRPVKNENAILRRQLKSLSTQRIKLENQLRQLQGEKSELGRRLNEIELFLQDRVSRTKLEATQAPKESVELPTIIVRPQTAPSVVTPAQREKSVMQEKDAQVYVGGSVLGVNKENNFVIIDLGQNTGIKLGNIFKVYREGRVIAAIEVIQVRESVSACDIREEITPVKVGDTIR